MATQTQTQTATGKLSARGGVVPLEPTGALDKYSPRELTPVLGTQFETVQLGDLLEAPNADELFRELAITIHRRTVVFFKNQQQQLTNAQLKTIATKLGLGGGSNGALHIHPTELHGDDAEISPITAQALKRSRNSGTTLAARGWHTDITFEPVPSDIALLNVWQIPEEGGGDTLWASAYEAYDRLTPAFAKFVEGLTALHDGTHFEKVAELRGTPLYTDVRGHPDNVGKKLQAVHPVVRTNPVTGWKGLFVNPVFTKKIVELNHDESERVLSYLYDVVRLNHDLQVRFKWDQNDVALWSNTSSFHNVTLDYAGTNRTGHRAVSLGEKPFFEPASRSRREALGLPAWLSE
ncbi:hypothetical protein JCM10207_002535 [Rhodosporidiobolus poonsookiae]